jgi:hypothetical protein
MLSYIHTDSACPHSASSEYLLHSTPPDLSS